MNEKISSYKMTDEEKKSLNIDKTVLLHMVIRLNKDNSLNTNLGFSGNFFSHLKRNDEDRKSFLSEVLKNISERIGEAK